MMRHNRSGWRKRRLGWVLLWLCPLLLILWGCARRVSVSEEEVVFGTRVRIQIEGVSAHRAHQALHLVFQLYRHLHHMLHPWDPTGLLMQLNQHIAQGQPFDVPQDLCHILEDAQSLAMHTHDYFNPAIGNEVRAWGFYTEGQPSAPDEALLDHIVQHHPSLQMLTLTRGLPGGMCRVSSTDRTVRIDLSGYAKGLALDRGAEILRLYGIRHALLNAGGNVMAIGRHADGRLWVVGLRDPRRDAIFALLPLYPGEAVGTSGDYFHYISWHGHRYGHILNPRTGYPVHSMMSVTVLIRPQDARWSSVGVLSDVMSKPFFVVGAAHFEEEVALMAFPLVVAFDAKHHMLISSGMMDRLRVLPMPLSLVHPAHHQ